MATTQKLGCLKINTILVVAFFMCDIERQISYQITALPEFYKIEFQNQLPWLPDCIGNQRCSQNLPTFYLPFHFSYNNNPNYKYNFTFGASEVVNRHLCFRNEYQMCAYFMGFHGNISL